MLAPIVEQDHAGITFRVDDVEISTERHERVRAEQCLVEIVGAPLCAYSHREELMVARTSDEHPLLSAVHLAFSRHHPLVLTPDAVWLILAQGFAQHVNNHAEALRGRFVRHAGRQTVRAVVTELSLSEHWADAVEQFRSQLRTELDPQLVEMVCCDFSTTTPTMRIASEITLMDAFQRCFDS